MDKSVRTIGSPSSAASAVAHLLAALVFGMLALLSFQARLPVPPSFDLASLLPVDVLAVSSVIPAQALTAAVLAASALFLTRRAVQRMGSHGRFVLCRDKILIVNAATGKVERTVPYLTIATVERTHSSVHLRTSTGEKLSTLKPVVGRKEVDRLFDEVARRVDEARTGFPTRA